MINKQNLWFLTLFSLILVLSIYYLTMPDEVLKTVKTQDNNTKETVNIEESDALTALRTPYSFNFLINGTTCSSLHFNL